MRWVSASLKIFVKALPGLSVPPPSDVGAPLPNWLSCRRKCPALRENDLKPFEEFNFLGWNAVGTFRTPGRGFLSGARESARRVRTGAMYRPRGEGGARGARSRAV